MSELITKDVGPSKDAVVERQSRWREFRRMLREQPVNSIYDYPFKTVAARNAASKVAYSVAKKWGFCITVRRDGSYTLVIYKFKE